MKTIDITIKIVYDENRFPEDDMVWAVDKLTECEQICNIGYDWESFSTSSEIVYSDGGILDND